MATKRPTTPQDHKPKKATKAKAQEMHDPSEMFTYTSPFTGIEIEVPYMENIPGRATRKAMEAAGDLGEGAALLALLKELLQDDFESVVDEMLQRETAEFFTKWQSESVVSLGE